ncbi:hypothetical protein TWF192_005602 [Orbilia oligospora]|uniref:Uncharacterized protein n=1 Tax=Orbilia oligospora TaxID=2813651 RepID=A0A6G1M8S5_ORBOL|nr:hypothetical protein TWF679_000996 [Orbilia oligospora]KAF3249529.1 hypothetical protein TWF192_005602 [Orbilia oligospora]
MVCEYTLFNFPGCGCPALVPLRFCPEHLDPDPKNICYQEGRDAAQNPARITMLFGGPAQPISLQVYERMCNLYKTPLLAKDPKLSDKSQQQSYERLAKLMMNMQKHTVDWHDGGTVKAGFHTKLTRYHVIYPSCGNMRLERPADERFWPFAETKCIEHSGDLVEDKVNNKWTFAPRPQLELFNEPFEHRFNAAIAVRFLKSVDKGDKFHQLIYDLPGCYPERYDPTGKTYKPTDENTGNQSDESDSSNGSEEPKTGGGHGKKKKKNENEKVNNGKKNESGSEYQGTETKGNGEESGPKGKKEVESPAKKNNGDSKKSKPQGRKQEHEVVTSTNTTIPVPKKKPAAKRKPKKDDDGEWKESGEDEDDEDIEEKKGGNNNGKKTSDNKKDTATTETKPKAEGGKTNPNSNPTNNGPKKPNTNSTNRNNEDNNANQGNDEDTNDEDTNDKDELSEVFTEMSPPKTRRRPKRGEEQPEFSGLRRVIPSQLDEVGSGLRLYRALGNSREPSSSRNGLEQLNLPSTNQTIDDIFNGWAQNKLQEEDI